MYQRATVHPDTWDISFQIIRGGRRPDRWIEVGTLGIAIRDRAVLDAFQGALDAIRADFDASEGIAEQAERPRGPLAAEAVPA
jgi:hypothetical protein